MAGGPTRFAKTAGYGYVSPITVTAPNVPAGTFADIYLGGD
jgi:hypothetical protein